MGVPVAVSAQIVDGFTSVQVVMNTGLEVYRDVKLFGSIASAKKSMLGVSVDGVVQSVDVMSGQRVAKGDVLLRLDPEAAQSRYEKAVDNVRQTLEKLEKVNDKSKGLAAQYAKGQHIFVLAEKTFARQQRLREHEVITNVQLDEAAYRRDEKKAIMLQTQYQQALLQDQKLALETEVARAKSAQKDAENWLKRKELRAPFAGKVQAVLGSKGQHVTKQDALVELIDNNHFQVRAVLSHAEVAALKKQQSALKTLPVSLRFGQHHVPATIHSILPASQNDLIGVDMMLEAGAEIERYCGDRVDFSLHMPTGQRRFTVPEAALYHDQYIHVVNTQNRIERIPVTVERQPSLEAQNLLTVLSDQLPTQAVIVTDNKKALVPGMLVTAVEASSGQSAF